MIAEPYINLQSGDIYWHREGEKHPGIYFQQYADFERDKLEELFNGEQFGTVYAPSLEDGFCLKGYNARDLIGYDDEDHYFDSESSRLLKRAEFLKAVCEKEGVKWLPNAHDMHACDGKHHPDTECDCKCHTPTPEPERGGHDGQIDVKKWLGRTLPPGASDTYTRSEIDERMNEVITFVEMKLMCTRGPTCEVCKSYAKELRSRFLPPTP